MNALVVVSLLVLAGCEPESPEPLTAHKLAVPAHAATELAKPTAPQGAERVEARTALRGMFTYMADAAMFENCDSGLKVPVAQEADYLALEKAYVAARAQPGEAVLVHVVGRIAQRPPMEATGTRDTLIVEKFNEVMTGSVCAGKASTTVELENTVWKLKRFGDEPVSPGAGGQEITITLVSNRRVRGFAGCNRFTGSYEVDGDSIKFKGIAATRMACPDGMAQESRFFGVIETAVRWKIIGVHLELFDAGGTRLVKFSGWHM